MLDFIIKTSSNPNSLVLDCFCGSGSTLLSAIRNQRNWIGIDASDESMKVVKKQLKEQGGTLFGEYSDYDFIHLKGTK